METSLRALSALFLLAGLGALIWQPRLSSDQAAPGISATVGAAPSAKQRELAPISAISAGNIFSRARKAPAVRYDPMEADRDRYAPAVPFEAPAQAPEDGESSVPRLFGIMAGPLGVRALLRLDAGAAEAQLYREGDRGGAYRVVKINAQSVTLSGPNGQIVLRLIRPEGQTP